MRMWGAWILCLVVLALACVTLVRFQRATTLSGQVVGGAAAMVSGLVGLLLLAVLVLH